MQKTETKVKAATVASSATTFVLWILATYVFHGNVPQIVAGIIALVVPGLVTWAAAYRAAHTPRPTASTAQPPPASPPPAM